MSYGERDNGPALYRCWRHCHSFHNVVYRSETNPGAAHYKGACQVARPDSEKALEAHNAILEGNEAKIRRLKHEFRVRLNPKDCCDNRILDCMKVKCTLKCRKKKAEEFSKQVSLLLKHDWERAKLEVGFHPIAWLTKMEPRRSCGGNSVDFMGDRLPCGKTFKRWYKRYKLNLCNSRVLFFFFPILVGVVTYYSGDIWSFLRSLCSGCT